MSELQFEKQISTIDQFIIESEQLLEQKKEDIEENHRKLRVLGKSKEIRIDIEEKYKDKPPVMGIPIDTNEVSAYIIGTEREKGIIQISGEETIAELELRIRQKLGFSSKLDIILIYEENYLKVGEKFNNIPITENTKIVDLIGENPISDLVIYSQAQIAGAEKDWEIKLNDLKDAYQPSAGVIDIAESFTERFYKIMRNNPDNFFTVFDRKEFFTEYLRDLDILVKESFNIFEKNGFYGFTKSLENLLVENARKLDSTITKGDDKYNQIVSEAKEITKRIRESYQNTENPDEVIKHAILTGIVKEICDFCEEGELSPADSKRDETFDLLKKNLCYFKENKYFESNQFITLSILSCTTHTFAVSNDNLYVQEGFDSGTELEVFSITEILPQQQIWMLENKYKLVDSIQSRIHDINVENTIKVFKFGPATLRSTSRILSDDAAYFDVGKFYYQNDKGEVCIVYMPNKNSMGIDKEQIDGSVENVLRAVYETNNDMIEGKIPKALKTEVILVAPFFSQESIYNTYISFGNNYLPKVAKGVDLGTGCWQESRERSKGKLSISDGHKFNSISQINEILGLKEDSNDEIFTQFETDFSNRYSRSTDDFIPNLIGNLEQYWGIQYNSKGEKQFGLTLQGSIRMYMDTGQKLEVEQIKPFLDAEEGLKNIKLSEDGKHIDEACVLGFKMDENGNPIYRFFSVQRIKDGLPRDSVWQLGYPRIINHNEESGKNTYNIIPQVVITYDNGHILRGEYALHETDYFIVKDGIYQLQNYGEKWCTPDKNSEEDWFEKNILEDYRKEKYGFKTLFYEVTRYGNFYKILGNELDLTTMKLKFDINRLYNRDRFKDESFEKRSLPKRSFIPAFSYFREYPITEELNNLIIDLRKDNLLPIFDLAKEQYEFLSSGTTISDILRIEPVILKVLNSYIDESGLLHEGQGYNELNFLFKYFIGLTRTQIICFNTFHSRVNNPGSSNLKFNLKQSDKDWFKAILDAFQSYESPPDLINPTLKQLDKKILEWKMRFIKPNGKNRIFSDGPDLKQYDKYEDGTLAELVYEATIEIFGRFTFSSMIRGGIFFDGQSVDFIKLSLNTYRQSFIHNNRLMLDFFSVKNQLLGVPPALQDSESSLPYIFYSIMFGPIWNLKIIQELNEQSEDLLLRTPYIPTDYWNPSFVSDRDIISRLGYNELVPYSSFLCTYLSDIFNFKASVQRYDLSGKINIRDTTRILLNYIYYKFKEGETIKKYTGENKDYYLNLVEVALYNLLFLRTSEEYNKERSKIMDFLTGKIDTVIISLRDLILESEVPDIFKSVTLTELDRVHWRESGTYEMFIKNFRVNVRKAVDLNPLTIINALEEPISRFGKTIKDLAIRYANPNVGNSMKLYIIPLTEFSHGRTQSVSRNHQNKYLMTAKDTISISGITWYCWELDGTNKASLDRFKNNYNFMLWCLLEGQVALSIVARDEVTGEIIHVGTFNILTGALELNQISPSDRRDYKTITYTTEYDMQFSDEINLIMELFRQISLPFVTAKEDNIKLYNFIF